MIKRGLKPKGGPTENDARRREERWLLFCAGVFVNVGTLEESDADEFDPEESIPDDSNPEESDSEGYESDEYEPKDNELDEPMATQPCQDVKEPRCHLHVEAQPQLYKRKPGVYAAGERAAIAVTFPPGNHYLRPGEGRPLPAKSARRDPQQGQRLTVAIDE